MKFIIYRGLPGSGKSTTAEEYLQKYPDTVLVNRDTLRILNPGKGEEFIRKLRDELIENALILGDDVISDDTNLIANTFDHLVALGRKYGAEIEIKTFYEVSVEECIRRDKLRPNSVGEKVIRRFVKDLNMAKNVRQPLFIPSSLPTAIICDIDGTLALFTNRGPFEMEKCESDALSVPVATVLADMSVNHTIILMSGRDEKFRPQTERWLNKHDVRHTALYMRPTGDMRKDAIVKHELFDAHIKDKYNILFALDDRDQMVRMYRDELKIVCFQVADGAF